MLIEAVSNDVVAICLGQLELEKIGPGISGDAARELVVQALKNRGEEPWPEIEVELFTSKHSLLLLARPARQKMYCFMFDSIEPLISAVAPHSCSPESSLFYYKKKYCLFIRETPEKTAFSFFEYGKKLDVDTALAIHIREHGHMIICENAVSHIRKYFNSDC